MALSTDYLDMIDTTNKTLCFIKAVTTDKNIKAMVMSDEEYFETYVSRFVGMNKQIKVNLLRLSGHVLMRSFSGYTTKRFDAFGEEIATALERIMASN